MVIVKRWLWVGKGVHQADYCLIDHPLFIISHFHSRRRPNHCIVRWFIAIHISFLDAQQTPLRWRAFYDEIFTLSPRDTPSTLHTLLIEIFDTIAATAFLHCHRGPLSSRQHLSDALSSPPHNILLFLCLQYWYEKIFSAFTLSYISSCYSLVHTCYTRGMPCMS